MTLWLPSSLFSRLVLVLLGGLLVAQVASLAIHSRERGELLLRASGAQSAQRIADIVRLLESSDAAGRRQIAAVLAQPPLVVRLDRPALPDTPDDARSGLFGALLQRALGEGSLVEAVEVEATAATRPPLHGPAGAMGPAMRGRGGEGWGMHGGMAPAMAFVAQVRLRDGTLATFDARQSGQTAGWPYRLLASLGVLLGAVVVLSLLAVRWTTQPLDVLADAADDLGRNIHRAPLLERGPREVARAARAFNTMQGRLLAYVSERTSLLAAMSHDLKTPLTRLRLRAELLGDAEMRGKFTADLAELEALVAGTLDYLQGATGAEAIQPVDVAALLASVQADLQEMGQRVSVSAASVRPFPGQPVALKRCVRNLVENAVKYGSAAAVAVQDSAEELQIAVRDEGPGLPPDELERVFQPFYRREASRNRATGGSGLGLTIARSIAQRHGGALTLRNHPQGGLEARLRLPRTTTATPPG